MTTSVLYDGPSVVDPSRNVVVLGVEHSSNRKTGDQVQIYFLLRDHRPYEVYVSEQLRHTICQGCAIGDAQACYLQWENGPTSVWMRYQRGGATPSSEYRAFGRSVRLGAAGNPSAAPLEVTQTALRYARAWTGFEHDWFNPANQGFRSYCMASVETLDQRAVAKELGWRTYRVMAPGDTPAPGEILCPATHNEERKARGLPPVTCEYCGICCGTAGTRENGGRVANVDVAIPVHGLPYKVQRFAALVGQQNP